MSLEALLWVVDLPLNSCSASAFRVLAKLADRADKLGYGAYPKIGTLAAQLECSERTVQRAIRELIAEGLIREGDPTRVRGARADRVPNVYDLMTPALVLHEHLRSRGDNPVTPSASRGDNSCRDGVTTVVAQGAVLEPFYQDSPRHLTLVTARESEPTR